MLTVLRPIVVYCIGIHAVCYCSGWTLAGGAGANVLQRQRIQQISIGKFSFMHFFNSYGNYATKSVKLVIKQTSTCTSYLQPNKAFKIFNFF